MEQVPHRCASSGWGGMAGMWSRLKNGISRTDNLIQKLQKRSAEDSAAAGAAPPAQPAPARPSPQAQTPWERLRESRMAALRRPPPTLLWMQSPYVRGSTQKMTAMARQIIGLPLDAALLQMHFSKRRPAQVVKQVLSQLKGTLTKSKALPAHFYVKSAVVGRGTYLKRLEIRARGRHGIQWRGHTFIRICVHKPDPEALVKKMLRIKHIPREDTPIMKRLDYY